MKGTTAFLPNKKLILHFDVDEVIKLSTKGDKDLFVTYHSRRYTSCALHGSGENYKKIAKKTLIK
jgi:hypothetical protein